MVAADIAVTPTQAGRWQAGYIQSAFAKVTIGSAVETGDTWTFTNMLPSEDVEVLSGTLFGVTFDTNATPTATVIIGDGTDVDGFLVSKTSGATKTENVDTETFHLDGLLVGGAKPASRSPVVTLGGTVATAASSGDFFLQMSYYCRGA